MRTRDAVAGALAVGVALAIGELVAGLSGAVPSPLVAVQQALIPRLPDPVVGWAIETLGTANRPVLAGASLAVALVTGAGVGVAARRSYRTAALVFIVVAAGAVPASLSQPDAAVLPVVVGLALATAAGLITLHRLLAVATPAPTPAPPEPSRRAFLRAAAGVAAATLVTAAIGRLVLTELTRAVDPSAVRLPRPSRALPQLGSEHVFATPTGISPLLTPADRFYRIDTAVSVPQVDPATWRLRLHGLVDHEVELTYDDLLALRLVEVDATLACVSNEVGGDLIGTARWLGVPLSDVLGLAGIGGHAEQVVGRSVDGWTAGFPIDAALDDRSAIVAVGMNGDPLPTRHGFPARLVVPGLFGYVSATKWLSDIELATWDGFDGYWVPRGWAKEGPIKTSSRIDVPAGGSVDAGPVVVAGVAWAPREGVSRVEVRVDDGPWLETETSVPLSVDTWVQWRRRLELAPGEHRVTVRAVDGDGRVQPEGPKRPAPDGAEGWHQIRVRAA